MNFEYRGLPWNIVFGHGSLASLSDRLAAMGLSRALVLSTPNQSDDGLLLCDLLGDKAAGLFDQAVMHVHFHVIPRLEPRGLGLQWQAGELGEDAGELARRITEAMPGA